MRFAIFDRFVAGESQRRNNQDLLDAVNAIGQLVYFGAGAPTLAPVDFKGNPTPALYLRNNGGTTTTLYVYDVNTTTWTAK